MVLLSMLVPLVTDALFSLAVMSPVGLLVVVMVQTPMVVNFMAIPISTLVVKPIATAMAVPPLLVPVKPRVAISLAQAVETTVPRATMPLLVVLITPLLLSLTKPLLNAMFTAVVTMAMSAMAKQTNQTFMFWVVRWKALCLAVPICRKAKTSTLP